MWKLNKTLIKNLFTLSIIMSILICSGCISKKDDESIKYSSENPPTPIIKAPEKSFFDKNITFDASDSFDTDGEIISYSWNMGNKDTLTGEKINYTYKFKNDFNLEIPIIYTVVLTVTDDENHFRSNSYQISLYPKEYIFYLSLNNKLVFEKEDTVKTQKIPLNYGVLSELYTVKYSFSNAINIAESDWALQLNVDKRVFGFLNKIIVKFYDEFDSEYEELTTTKNFNFLSFIGNDDSIKIDGKITKEVNLKYITVSFQGVGLKNSFNIVYFEKPYSKLIFDFRNTYDV
jgi:hypothetical protein